MKFTTSLLAITGLVAAAPSKTLSERANSCGQWDSVVTGTYTVYNNLWGQDSATSGSGCFSVESLSGKSVAWSASWSWAGAANVVKAYPNVVVTAAAKRLSEIASIESSWAWKYGGADVVANVAYDLFTSSTAAGEEEFEIMIWLAAIGGAGPISSAYGADGKPTAIATVTLVGHEFSLFKGPNGQMTVFSFVPKSEIANFSGDLKAFVDYLVTKQGLDQSQYLISTGAGTEPFTGTNAVFNVSGYSVNIA
ncbi:related to Probable xyloglucan-specific endo-beta-1,4-glucanase A [Ramularia collo-cygni]|uniref:Related to Probable xyloglucan-specific endo-beta-1,4-glucanase A n=1 Tax=Ramularia collo-cygni TaxID=112498 RepID=A0A2D3V3B4_9PEZI|nr:related to Probable xyloglucan-specific endo-beta-1,4-glucanase A [Ramularia collo-cygni]CZT22308.1 related to Probable xyloglucan-specific endo-beta-1,4-glucanase A [Ramularia collo-cygni]